MLPWLPLMIGGDDRSIIERLKQIAETEPDSRLRSDYAGLAQVFADAADRKEIWVQSLKGWNVKESSVVNQWLQEGRAEGRAEGRQLEIAAAVVAVLESRFNQVPADLIAAINATKELSTLRHWLSLAAKVEGLEEFRKIGGI